MSDRHRPVLVAGEWQRRSGDRESFRAVNPATRSELPELYPVSGPETLEAALSAGREAARDLLRVPPEKLARFLEACAENIEARAEALVETAHVETALPKDPRLRSVELPRTAGQLRQAARAVRERSFCRPTLDTQANIRSMHGPLGGVVVVLGPNNFPFAFNSVMGGDFAAAIAAGSPVLAKANPGHPGTTGLLAEAAFDAVRAAGLPPATVQLLYRLPRELGLALVAHPAVGATAFTGSRAGGLRLEGGGRPGRETHLPRDVERESGLPPSGRDRGARRRAGRGAVWVVQSRRRAVLHQPRNQCRGRGRRDREVRGFAEGSVREQAPGDPPGRHGPREHRGERPHPHGPMAPRS